MKKQVLYFLFIGSYNIGGHDIDTHMEAIFNPDGAVWDVIKGRDFNFQGVEDLEKITEKLENHVKLTEIIKRMGRIREGEEELPKTNGEIVALIEELQSQKKLLEETSSHGNFRRVKADTSKKDYWKDAYKLATAYRAPKGQASDRKIYGSHRVFKNHPLSEKALDYYLDRK